MGLESPPFWIASSSFYTRFHSPLNVHASVEIHRADTCPISPYPKWLGVVVKTEKHGSVRCRVLNCSSGSLSLVLCRFSTFPVLRNDPESHHQKRVAPFVLGYIYGRGGSFPWPRGGPSLGRALGLM